jgi:amidase
VVGQPLDPAKLDPLTRKVCEIGKRNDSAAALSAVALMEQVSRGVAAFFGRYDVHMTPTLAEPPVSLGTLDASEENAFAALLRAGEFAPFTVPANVTGNPAMSVPLCWNAEGLPIGVHFLGRYGDEATLLRLAAQLERARPWRARVPAIAEGVP